MCIRDSDRSVSEEGGGKGAVCVSIIFTHMYTVFIPFQGKGKLLFFKREMEKVYQLAVSDAVGS